MRKSRLRFAPATVASVPLDGGGILLRSPLPLGPYARCVGDWLERWAAERPEQEFLVDHTTADEGGPRRLDYRTARQAARSIGAALLDLGLSATRPLLLLGDNGLDHALLQLGAMHAGVPVAPLPPAYSLLSRDHAKLRDIAARVEPGAVWADDGELHERALGSVQSVRPGGIPVLHSKRPPSGRPSLAVSGLLEAVPGPRLDEAFSSLGPDSVAKILFTSGATGWPRGVVNTHRMLCSNQQAIAELWRFLDERPPVIVDWLPWSHTFGGNFNLLLALRSGGTFHVDHGAAAPGSGPGTIGATVELLREVAPTLYLNVPRGFEVLLPVLEQDEELRGRFFSRLDALCYAGAALPQRLWRRLERVAELAGERTDGGAPAILSAWGSTETGPLATAVHFHVERAGNIGLPAPGSEIKLCPAGDKLEIRVRGPNVTPGIWERGGAIVPASLDESGFLATGDAARLEDPLAPERGVVFDGRIAENFKLSSGTWVSVGEVRQGVIAAGAPLVQDVVVTGHDQRSLGLLVFPSLPACRAIAGEAATDLPVPELLALPVIRERLRAKLDEYNYENPGSSTRIARLMLLADPPSIDDGEITDRGYLNQQAVLARRADRVARLHGPRRRGDTGDPDVIDLLEDPQR